MTPRQECLQIIETVGAEVDEYDGLGLQMSLYTPEGVVWRATDCHTLTVNFMTDRPAGWLALLADLRLGVGPCSATDCEMCGASSS